MSTQLGESFPASPSVPTNQVAGSVTQGYISPPMAEPAGPTAMLQLLHQENKDMGKERTQAKSIATQENPHVKLSKGIIPPSLATHF